MKKLIFTFILTLLGISSFGQGKWKKEYVNDEFTNTSRLEMIHYNTNKKIDAIWNDGKLTIFSNCSKPKALSLSKQAISNTNGKIDDYTAEVYVNYSGGISMPSLCVSYPIVEEPTNCVFSMITIPINSKEMKYGDFVSIKYYDENFEDLIITKIDLKGFDNIYSRL